MGMYLHSSHGHRLTSSPELESPKPIYSIDALLAMRRLADESVKDKMRAECPEVVMNRKTRKTLEYLEHQQRRKEKEARMEQRKQHSREHSVSPIPSSSSRSPSPVAPEPVTTVEAVAAPTTPVINVAKPRPALRRTPSQLRANSRTARRIPTAFGTRAHPLLTTDAADTWKRSVTRLQVA